MQHLPLQHPHAEGAPSFERGRGEDDPDERKEKRGEIGESLFDPRNGSSTVEKGTRRSRCCGRLAAASHLGLHATILTPRPPFPPCSPLVPSLVVVIVVAGCCSVACLTWPRSYVAGIYTPEETWPRLSHVRANLVIRPPPG